MCAVELPATVITDRRADLLKADRGGWGFLRDRRRRPVSQEDDRQSSQTSLIAAVVPLHQRSESGLGRPTAVGLGRRAFPSRRAIRLGPSSAGWRVAVGVAVVLEEERDKEVGVFEEQRADAARVKGILLRQTERSRLDVGVSSSRRARMSLIKVKYGVVYLQGAAARGNDGRQRQKFSLSARRGGRPRALAKGRPGDRKPSSAAGT